MHSGRLFKYVNTREGALNLVNAACYIRVVTLFLLLKSRSPGRPGPEILGTNREPADYKPFGGTSHARSETRPVKPVLTGQFSVRVVSSLSRRDCGSLQSTLSLLEVDDA